MITARLPLPRLAFWPRPIIFRLDASARQHKAVVHSAAMTSQSLTRVICVYWTH